MQHAHFLQMGGFRVNYIEADKFHCSEDYRFETKKERIVVKESVLNFDDLQYLLTKQLINFPDTTEKEIEDRSKGDALSKGFALLQITWFTIQLIARAQQHLTITEIELTTAALAGLTSIMYLLWWSKPLDVRCPIVIRTKMLESMLEKARNADEPEETEEGGGNKEDMSHFRSRSVEVWTFTMDKFRLRDYLRDSPAWVAVDLAARKLCPKPPNWMRTICCRIGSFVQSRIWAQATHLRSLAMSLLQAIRPSLCLPAHRTKKVVGPEIRLQSSDLGPENSSVTRLDFRRDNKWIWRTGKLVITNLFYFPYLLMFLPMDQILRPGRYFDFQGYSDAKDKMHTKSALQLFLDVNDMEWIMSMMFYSERGETRPLLIFSALAGAAFGSIHCAAWHFDFPSPVERILWQTASLTIVGLCLFIIAISPVYTRFVYDKWLYSGGTEDMLYWTRLKETIEALPVIIYPVARLSLLILALLSLRQLPPSAFDTVVWTKFIPHI